jgi:hypothetical protein
MRFFPRWIKYPLDLSIDRLVDRHFCVHHGSAIFRGLDQHLDGRLPVALILLGFGELAYESGGVPQRWRRSSLR